MFRFAGVSSAVPDVTTSVEIVPEWASAIDMMVLSVGGCVDVANAFINSSE